MTTDNMTTSSKVLMLLTSECKTPLELLGTLQVVNASIVLALEETSGVHRNKVAHDLCKGIKDCVPARKAGKHAE